MAALPDWPGLLADLRARAVRSGSFTAQQITQLEQYIATLPPQSNTQGTPLDTGCLHLQLLKSATAKDAWFERLLCGSNGSNGAPLLNLFTGRVWIPAPSRGYGLVPPTLDAESSVPGVPGSRAQHEVKLEILKLSWAEVTPPGHGLCWEAKVDFAFSLSHNQMAAFRRGSLTLPAGGGQVTAASAFVGSIVDSEDKPYIRVAEMTANDIVRLAVGEGRMRRGGGFDTYRVKLRTTVTTLLQCQADAGFPGLLRTAGECLARVPHFLMAEADLPRNCPLEVAEAFFNRMASQQGPGLRPVVDARL